MREKCFIVGSLEEYAWKVRMANMERRVNSKSFQGGHYEAVSPRMVVTGKECRLKRNFKLRMAMRSCPAVYVLKNFAFDPFAAKLVAVAERRGKTLFYE